VEAMSERKNLLISYLALRTSIGSIGALLPAALVVSAILGGEASLRVSVSSYYYSAGRDIFVGGLCSIGTFLVSYRGYDRWDRRAALVAGSSAVCVAMFPVDAGRLIGSLHLLAAALLFSMMATFCLIQFPKGSAPHTRLFYKVCGTAILASMAKVCMSVGREPSIFWPELIAIEAFSVAWLVKGKTLMPDRRSNEHPVRSAPYQTIRSHLDGS
jgi:hypothetical protein